MTIDATAAAEMLASHKRERLRWKSFYSSDAMISLLGFVLLAGTWEAAVYLFKIPDFILPAPSRPS